jgi:cellulose synthase (UDP-forming)
MGGHWLVTSEPGRVCWEKLLAGIERVAWSFKWVTPESDWWWVLTPGIVTAALCGLVVTLFPTPPNWLRVPVGLMFTVFQVIYLGFRVTCTLSLDTVPNATISIAFLLAEAFIHLRVALGNISLMCLTDRKAQADRSEQLVSSGEYLPTVDVYVPTYSEPVEMLRRTIIGCQAMDYPCKTIYLLDDQRRPAMRALAEELGCTYICRPDNQHAKAGNLNHALGKTRGELILCFDADFVPTRDFLRRTVGFFRDPQVAMVQTPQNFFNEDAVTRNFGLDGVLDDEQRLFFRALQPGRDTFNAVVCHGSCFVVRRAALLEIGGVPTETITEDWATSIQLQAKGYRVVYLNEALSAGVAADKVGEFVQQRARWAQGTLQALFASTHPLKIKGLTWKQRFLHFNAILYYLGSLSTLFNLIAPLFFLFFGLVIVRMTLQEMLFFRLPFTVAYYLLFAWLTCYTRSALWTELYEAFLAPSMGLTALRSLVKPFGKGFRVTDKSMRAQGLRINQRVAMPFALLLLLHVSGILAAMLLGRNLEDRHTYDIALYFAASNVVVLWLCILASIDVAQPNLFPRFKHRLRCLIVWDDTGLEVETSELSEGDLVFKAAHRDQLAGLPRAVFVTLPALELRYVPALLTVDYPRRQVTAQFLDVPLEQQRALIEFLFCQRSQWDRRHRPQNEPRVMWEYFRAGVRMYSLAESQ